MVIGLHVMQFCSKIILVISNQTLAVYLFDFEIMHLISDQIALNSVQLPLHIYHHHYYCDHCHNHNRFSNDCYYD